MAIETNFDVSFVAKLTSEEKQIQQNYRPVIGVHKWFARRPGALFRSLLLSEFTHGLPLAESYYRPHDLQGLTIADPFMGGGTTLFEANRLGCNVVGSDINPMAFWIVRQELMGIDRRAFRQEAEAVIGDVRREVDGLYETECVLCQQVALVKYFLWVKQQRCGSCGNDLDLFPGYLIAGNARHPNFVLHCPGCQHLVEVPELPEKGELCSCPNCRHLFDWTKGPASRNRYTCSTCGHEGRYPAELRVEGPPRHRLIGMEYHCACCRPAHRGRFFKTADAADRNRAARAAGLLAEHTGLELPEDEIPDGDETKRLHRWGYQRYREMFDERQLLTLGLLRQRIKQVAEPETRHALATVFSDSLRYQNMLCRYDSYSLKCQDIFSVHGFPVGLIQCENNVLGIPRVGSGSFCHFVEKYDRAKAYCEKPFETVKERRSKRTVSTSPERIEVTLVSEAGELQGLRRGLLAAASIEDVSFAPESLDAVMTDPPYFDNVQYAELMDFCYAWLRPLLGDEFAEFRDGSTRSARELTGNATTGKGFEHFTEGLSRVFRHAAKGLKPGAAFVLTYHHNELEAYVPVVVAILDAGLHCTATLPCPAEMTASLHINGTGSSIMDTIIVCRTEVEESGWLEVGPERLREWLTADRAALARGGVGCSRGDLYCLALGHLARVGVQRLRGNWEASQPVAEKMATVEECLCGLSGRCQVEPVIQELLATPALELRAGSKQLQASLFDEVGHGVEREHLATGSSD
jgi:putative DNA methylase